MERRKGKLVVAQTCPRHFTGRGHRYHHHGMVQVVIQSYVPSHFDGCLVMSSAAKNCVVILEVVICEGPKLAPLPGIKETHASMVTLLVVAMLSISMVCEFRNAACLS